MKSQVVGCLFVLLGATSSNAYSGDITCKPNFNNDGQSAIAIMTGKVEVGFTSNFMMLDSYVTEWHGKADKSPMCLSDDGSPWSGRILPGLEQAFKRKPNWDKTLTLINTIKTKYPKSQATTSLVEAKYWITYAWDARGKGYSSSVTDEGYSLYQERLEKAEKILIASKSYSSELPTWYEAMLSAQGSLGRSPAEMDKIFLEGVTKYKTYYPIYFTRLNFLLPKWGGTWGTVDNMVAWSVDNTRDAEGESVYARLYWTVYKGLDDRRKLFSETHASWPKMKKGFEDMMQRYPNSNWNLNHFAKFACIAKDKKIYVALRNQIGANVDEFAWNDDTSIDLCDSKMGYSKRSP